MKENKVVTIKGRKYDSATGKPVQAAGTTTQKPGINTDHANSRPLYSMAQKSVKNGVMFAKKVGKTMDIARSKSITRFSNISAKPVQTPSSNDIAAIRHPLVKKVETIRQTRAQAKIAQPKTAQQIKQEVIANAMKKVDNKKSQEPPTPKKRGWKIFSFVSLSILVVIMTGYLVYMFIPSISVKIASAQAGIDASYPEFCPDGYRPNGPVSYNDDEVAIDFRANTGNATFSIKQAKSDWDSSALKVKAEKDSGGKIITTNEKGLTIFTYDSTAVWVNGGILYTISWDAPLSADQVRRIATSL